MRVYVYDPSKRSEPKPGVVPPLPHCEICRVCLGEAAKFFRKYCDDCKPKAVALRAARYRNKRDAR